MLTLFLLLLLLGNITLSVVCTQYQIRVFNVSDEIIPESRIGPMWGDSAGNLYISDVYRRKKRKVRKIDSTGRVTIVIGADVMGDSWVTGLYGDSTGEILYISQEYNQVIWKHNISSNTTVQIGEGIMVAIGMKMIH